VRYSPAPPERSEIGNVERPGVSCRADVSRISIRSELSDLSSSPIPTSPGGQMRSFRMKDAAVNEPSGRCC